MRRRTTKDIIVLDTNTLIEYGNSLSDTVNKLSTKYDVYVTEVSIEEKLGQKYIEDMRIYSKIDEFAQQLSDYIRIEKVISFADKFSADEKEIRSFFSDLFGDRIIPFSSDETMLQDVFIRATRKTPPFTANDKSSDKGFKDSLMWLSILKYFLLNQFDITIFIISSDKSFCKQNSEFLENEFKQKTGLNIEFRDNSFCLDNIIENSDSQVDSSQNSDDTQTKERPHDLNVPKEELLQLRNSVSSAIHKLSVVEKWNEFDECFLRNAFTTYYIFENDKVKQMLDNLDDFLFDHLFQEDIAPSVIWDGYYSIIDKYNISYESLLEISNLYKQVAEKDKRLVVPFLNAICNDINSMNYVEPSTPEIDEDMPF